MTVYRRYYRTLYGIWYFRFETMEYIPPQKEKAQ